MSDKMACIRDEVMVSVPTLIAYPSSTSNPLVIQPARTRRDWMEQDGRMAYRCLPLSIANASGWEILSPATFEVKWAGGSELVDLRTSEADFEQVSGWISSISSGTLLMPTDDLFRTPPGWAVAMRGAPNADKFPDRVP